MSTKDEELDPVDQILYDAHELLESGSTDLVRETTYNRICHNVKALAQELTDTRRNLKYAKTREQHALDAKCPAPPSTFGAGDPEA